MSAEIVFAGKAVYVGILFAIGGYVVAVITKYTNVPDWAVNCKARKVALDQGWTWDSDTADRLARFMVRYCRSMTCEEENWQPIDYQLQILQSMFCWLEPSGIPGITTAVVHMARKNAKTYLAAVAILYTLLYNPYKNASIFSSSVDHKSARQIWQECRHFILSNKQTFKKHKLPYQINKAKGQESIEFPLKRSIYEAVSSEGKGSLGHNLVMAVLDETAHLDEHQGSLLWQALTTGQIARKKGVLRLSISTASFNCDGFYHNELYTKAKNQLANDELDPHFFGYVAECPAGMEDKPEGWHQANPGLGTIFTEDSFRKHYYEPAKGYPVNWMFFRMFHLNQFVLNRGGDWFDLEKYNAGETTIEEEILLKAPAVVSVDGSEIVDPSSVSICWSLGDSKFYCRSFGWACAGGVLAREKTNLPKYASFENDTFKIQDTENVNTEEIKQYVLQLLKTYNVKEIVFDGHNMRHIGESLEAMGYNVSRMPQTENWFTTPIREWTRAVSENRFFHNGSGWQRWCLTNAVLKGSESEGVKISRRKSRDKCDGAVSCIMAFGKCLSFDAKATPRQNAYVDEIICG